MSTGGTWEHEVANYLHSKGYQTEVRRNIGNHEIDVYATRANEILVVECKDWSANVSKNPVRTVHNNSMELDATPGLAYTSELTSGAKELADEYGVILFPAEIVRDEVLTLNDLQQTVRRHSVCLPNVSNLDDLDNPLGPFSPDPSMASRIADEALQESFEMESRDKDRVVEQIERIISNQNFPKCAPILRNDLGQIELYFIDDPEHHSLPHPIEKESVSIS